MIGTNCYLVINEETKDTVMVDPGSYPAKLKNAVKEQGLKLKAVLLTQRRTAASNCRLSVPCDPYTGAYTGRMLLLYGTGRCSF